MIAIEFVNQAEISASGLYQWDYGQELQIVGLDLPESVEIQFSLNEKIGDSVTMIGTTTDGVTTVQIPNDLLQNESQTTDYAIYVYIYVANETTGKTLKTIKLYVKARPKPTDYDENTPDAETSLLTQIKALINGKADNLSYSNNILTLLSGTTELARVTISGGGGSSTAREIELTNDGEYIKWKYTDATEWTNLVALEDLKGTDGTNGTNGASAYDIAVENGYDGTVTEWLESLKGADGTTYTPTIGTVTTLDAGESATASVSINGDNAIFSFGIPKGDAGESATGDIWTSTVTAYAGATSVAITNPLESTNIVVDAYNENASGTPVAITSIAVTTTTITLNFAEVSEDNNFICKLSAI